MKLLFALFICSTVFAGTIVPQQVRALTTIKTSANQSNNVPDLTAVVEALIEQVQKNKDALIKDDKLEDD